MSKRKHKFVVTSFDELKAAYPLAVTEETVVKQKANYSYVAKLLDCALPVPGVEVEGTQHQLNLTKTAKDA